MPDVLTDIDGRGVATVTLNRPDVHNAFNAEVIAELHAAVAAMDVHQDVRVIVLRGAGRSFSAGADLGWMREAAAWSDEDNRADAMKLAAMLDALNGAAKPTVALVQG
ncbi:MAG: enoyl-CoA hydratase/isomerase family protein, partial [Alphaproteobacteria bacterium]